MKDSVCSYFLQFWMKLVNLILLKFTEVKDSIDYVSYSSDKTLKYFVHVINESTKYTGVEIFSWAT